jgi:hypothetical protein
LRIVAAQLERRTPDLREHGRIDVAHATFPYHVADAQASKYNGSCASQH